ncbi:MAG TPA: right-handed parallel beta-helix repeat-containing protein, partial [Tepidisphaeraceae bacterium]|nr:right-handed parallel beta-helix repeat-containing protein [Tepidisphaeraceae bacterium]
MRSRKRHRRIGNVKIGRAVSRAEILEPRRLLSSVIYVDSLADGTDNGTSWPNAYTSVQVALGVASAGTTIEVSQGTYYPVANGNRTYSFQLVNGVSVEGGFAGITQPNPNAQNPSLYPSILSGDIGQPGTTANNSYSVVTATFALPSAVLDGFTITGGNNTNASGGGGLLMKDSNPTIENCTFIDNTAEGEGGAVGCSADFNEHGGPTFTNCTFTDNTAGLSGGAVAGGDTFATFTNCTFSNNLAGSSGGAVAIGDESTFVNCLFYGNKASQGGAISVSYAVITNCTFTENTATNPGSGNAVEGSAIITNCILWGDGAPGSNEAYGIYSPGAPWGFFYSDVEGGNPYVTGKAVLNTNPFFVNVAGDDFEVQPYSPVVDAGDNAAVPAGITTDLAGNPRFQDVPTSAHTGSGAVPIVDMGVYETTPALGDYAGGPYPATVVGQSIQLAGLGSSSVSGALTYSWDFNYDGTFVTDATGPDPVFNTTGYPTGTLTIALQVTDAGGNSALATTTMPVLPQLMYVDASASGTDDGSSWNNAYTGLQSALAAAQPGRIIEVGQGAYYPTTTSNQSATFQLMDGVAIEGGFAGTGAADPDLQNPSLYPTILSGSISATGTNTNNSYHVLTASNTNATAILNGFTITGGNANNLYGNYDNYGGGIYDSSGSPTISNCTFVDNDAITGGGAIQDIGDAEPVMTNCSFIDCAAPAAGAMGNYGQGCSPILTDCSFTDNVASNGGGGAMFNSPYCDPVVTDCTFTGNTNTAIINNQYSSPTFTGCQFIGNVGPGSYGGAMSNNDHSSPEITDCVFSGDSAYEAGAISNSSYSSPTIVNCLFDGDTASEAASEIFNNYGCDPVLINCTLDDPSAGAATPIYNVDSHPTFTNCILWGDPESEFASRVIGVATSSATITYSDVEGGSAGQGNIDANPYFIDAAAGDLQLEAYSPAVDAGNNAAVPAGITTDLASHPRFQDVPTSAHTGNGTVPVVDMGVYETTAALGANVGGPYTVDLGQNITLAGLGSSNVAGSLSFAWDFNYDGTFVTDATGANATFSSAGYAAGDNVPIALQVTDAGGNSIVATGSVLVVQNLIYVDSTASGTDDGSS